MVFSLTGLMLLKRYSLTDYELQNLSETMYTGPSAIKDTTEFLRRDIAGYFGLTNDANPCDLHGLLADASRDPIPDLVQGDTQRVRNLGGTCLHLDPAWAFNILFGWKFDRDKRGRLTKEGQKEAACDGGATWIMLSPGRFDEATEYLREKDLLDKKLTLKTMNAMFEDLTRQNKDGIWLINQQHGDLVEVPVGYAHAVINTGRNYKVALDVITEGTLHRCRIKQMYLDSEILKERVTNEYTGFNNIAFSELQKHLSRN